MNKRSLNIKKSQLGTILIVALFIVTLIEIVIVGLVSYHRTSIHHSGNYFNSMRATNVLLAGENWSINRILNSIKKNENMSTDSLNSTELNGATLEGLVYSAQGKFNINNLINSQDPGAFTSFISVLLNKDESIKEQVFNDIMSKVQIYTPLWAANNDILPYASATELRFLPGITQNTFEKINDNTIALPEITALNLNNATELSLLTLSSEITLQTARAIIQIRDNLHGFTSVDTFFALEPLSDTSINKDLVTIQSQYYISTMTVHYQNINLTLNSLLKVNLNENNPTVGVIWRSFGAI
ncbi:MAG: general secretion pathway protein GspK [Candidatus Berkiella sp.]